MRPKLYLVRLGVCLFAIAAALAGQAQTPQLAPQSQQGGSGVITGRVTGPFVQGATVTITNASSGAAQNTVIDSDGRFTFTNLPPGSYRLGVRPKTGPLLSEETIQLSDTTGAAVVTFSADNSSSKVEIEGRAPTLQTETAEVSREYESVTIRALPVLDRQNHELISLMPGITPPEQGDRITDPQRTRSFNVNGQPAWANLYNQDGTYTNEPFTNRPLRVEPNEAVQELQVRTSNYNAEYGVSGGSWANNVTRPGTNGIHGSLFAFHNDAFLRSGRTYNATTSTPNYNMNQFGGTVGGALVPDYLFGFLSYEGFLQRGSQEAVASVPTAAARAGIFGGVPGATIYNPFTGVVPGTVRTPFLGNTIPAAALNPAAVGIVGLLPLPNAPGTANNLVGSVPLRDDMHRMDGKLDHRFSETSYGFLRYGFTQSSVNQGSLLGAAGNPSEASLRTMSAAAGLTHVFSPTLLGELLVGYNRYRNNIAPWGAFGPVAGFPNGLPQINISGYSPLGFPANVPSKQVDNVYDGATNWNWHVGINSLKMGLSGRALEVNGITNPFFGSAGSFVFGPGPTSASTAAGVGLTPATAQANSLASFLTGTPTQSGINTFTTTPAYRQKQYGAYVVDTINLFQRVWVELGLRYDIFSPVQSFQPGGATVFNPVTNTSSPTGVNGVGNGLSL